MTRVEVNYICEHCRNEQTFEDVVEIDGVNEFVKCRSCFYWNTFKVCDIFNNGKGDERILNVSIECDTDDEPEFDAVNRPKGYNSYDIETINAIRGQSTDEEFQGYLKGNVIKYVARYNFKNGVEDIEKLITYAEFLRDHVKGEWKKWK